ncbi:putative metallopeptidase [Geobacillus jurassicus]|uniref:Metallopeptidase n=1 Tax=Geobacillus jurassicus TaxID=235932 RepID=A0ABV6GVF5_9BACL|nr:putative metallopeptidase [Geobacillus jurassicus]
MELQQTLAGNMKQGKEFIEKMDKVFASLRADFDVASSQLSRKKIEALKKMHVDVTGKVGTLSVLAKESNGLIQGLRGTGKSHLMLIARDEINLSKNHICIYVNLQEHLNVGGSVVVQERFYVWALLKQIKKQLMYIVEETQNEEESQKRFSISKIIQFFNIKKEKNVTRRLEEKFDELEKLVLKGEEEVIQFSKETKTVHLDEVTTNSNLELKGQNINNFGYTTNCGGSEKLSRKSEEKYKSEIILDIKKLKTLLIEIIELLGVGGITFFYDEWSALKTREQELLSEMIRALSSSPIYHWIAFVPYKSSLGVLEQAADLPHLIDLDLQFIYEENNKICMNYFEKFIENRLRLVFDSEKFKAKALIRPHLLEILVQCSMGNTRDFGIMLNKAWDYFKQDYLTMGRNRIISKKHVERAVKTLAEEKMMNLQRKSSSSYSERLWSEIVKFITQKKHTHFCIELSERNIDYIKEAEFTDLLYHRLVHLRKKDYPPKDGGNKRLSIYAVDVSVLFPNIFETKSQRKK